MQYFKIAGVRIAIDMLEGIPPLENFEPFVAEPGPVDITYFMVAYPPEHSPVPPLEEMDLVSHDYVNRLYISQSEQKIFKWVAMQEGDPRVMWFEQAFGKWNEATVYVPNNWLDYQGIGNVFSLEKTLLPFNALMLHCALIEHDGYGIAFSAPSQTGKSTQAGLWEKHKGARILNGDRAILRSEDGVIYAYGSPYAGSSNLFLDVKVPLKGIIMLEQAKENTIRPIPNNEGLGLFLSQSSLPIWEPLLFEKGMETLEAIITKVPMYMLSCLPDEGAVECAYQCLK